MPHRQQAGANKGDDVAGAAAGAQDAHLLEKGALLLRRLVLQALDGHGRQPIRALNHYSKCPSAKFNLLALLIQLHLEPNTTHLASMTSRF